MSKRSDRAARTVAKRRQGRSFIEVLSVVRLQPFVWEAEVEYSYGLSTWTDRVRFVVVLTENAAVCIDVSDPDHPQDGVRHAYVEPNSDGSLDMPQFIHDYLVAGRW